MRRVAMQAGIPISQIRWTGRTVNDWYSIIQAAEANNKMRALLGAVRRDYPDNPQITDIELEYWRDKAETVYHETGVDLRTRGNDDDELKFRVYVVEQLSGMKQDITALKQGKRPNPYRNSAIAASGLLGFAYTGIVISDIRQYVIISPWAAWIVGSIALGMAVYLMLVTSPLGD